MKWSMKVILLLLLLAFGVFLGIDTADKAVKQLTGAEEQSSTPSNYISRIENGKMVVVSTGGNKEQTEVNSNQKESTIQQEVPLKAATKNAEKENIVEPSPNGYLSQIGNDLGNKTTELTRSFLEKLLSFLTK